MNPVTAHSPGVLDQRTDTRAVTAAEPRSGGSAAEGGLYFYGYRYYDPVTGKWPPKDPIGEAGGLNLYCFGGNNPIIGVDVLGAAVVVVTAFGTEEDFTSDGEEKLNWTSYDQRLAGLTEDAFNDAQEAAKADAADGEFPPGVYVNGARFEGTYAEFKRLCDHERKHTKRWNVRDGGAAATEQKLLELTGPLDLNGHDKFLLAGHGVWDESIKAYTRTIDLAGEKVTEAVAETMMAAAQGNWKSGSGELIACFYSDPSKKSSVLLDAGIVMPRFSQVKCRLDLTTAKLPSWRLQK